MTPAKRKILIIVENLPVPFDGRVWKEACALRQHGYEVSVLSPKGKDYQQTYEILEGIHIYRHPMPQEGNRTVRCWLRVVAHGAAGRFWGWER